MGKSGGKGEREKELNASKDHSLMKKEYNSQTVAGVWLIQGGVLHVGAE